MASPLHPQRFRFELGKAAALSSQRLTIDDASFTIVKAIVEFLYSGQVPDAFMQSRGLDLLLAANRVRGRGSVGRATSRNVREVMYLLCRCSLQLHCCLTTTTGPDGLTAITAMLWALSLGP